LSGVTAPRPGVCGPVLFSGHLLYFEHFLCFPRQTSPHTSVETARLTHAVKNAWANRA
jgi:hypothetical protein